tara:strand:+ start:7254 stop:9563 length:2310 start_codon:yes stop_codon:yes gene_type:complete
MARRLPGGGIFRGTYAPKAISYDKPQADYMKMLQAGEKILPVADKILTPLLYDAVTGVTSAVGSLFKGGTEKVQQDIASSQSDNRSKVASKMLGNPVQEEEVTIDRFKDIETPKNVLDATRQNVVTTEYMRSIGLRPGDRGYQDAFLTLQKKAENLPEDVWTNLTDAQVRKLYEDPNYTGKELLLDIEEVENSVAERPALPDPVQRKAPAFDQFKDVLQDRAGSRAESVQQSRMGQIRGQIESEIDRLEASNILPRRQSYHDAIDLYNRGKIASIPNELLVLRDLKEKEKLEEIAPQLEPAQRGMQDAKNQEAALEKQMARFPRAGTELAQEQEQQLDEAKESFETQVKSAEDAVKVVARQPGGERAMRSFEQGYVQQVQDMPFTQVRAITSLSDPSRLSSAQVSALAERYRNEATPKSITSLISGEYLQEADKRFTKDFGRYGGFASAKERANIIAQREAMERERYKQGESFKRQTRTIDEQRKQFERVQTREEASDLSQAELNVATKALRESQALLNKQKKTTEVRRAQKLFLESQAISRKLNGGFRKGRNRGKFLPAFIQGELVQVWQGKIGNKIERLSAGSERFQQLVQTGQIKLNKAQKSLLNSYYKSLGKRTDAANKAFLAKQEIADALPGKIKAARAEYAAINGAAREIYGDRLNFSPSGITIDPPTKEELAERKALEGIIGLDPEGAEAVRTKEIQDRLKMTKKLNDTNTKWNNLREQFLKLQGSSSKKEKAKNKERAKDAAKSLRKKGRRNKDIDADSDL